MAGLAAAMFVVFTVFQGSTQPARTQAEGPGTGPTYGGVGGEQKFEAGKLIVQLEEDATQADLREINRENKARIEEDLPRSDTNVVDLPNDLTVREAVRVYESSPDVEYAEPNYKIYPTRTPSDPAFGKLYGLNNTGQTGGTPDTDIDAPEAWNTTTGNPSTVVAVIDEGVDVNHPDLRSNIWTNSDETAGNGIDDDRNGYVDDVNGFDFLNNDASVFDRDPVTGEGDEHGTHVAGTIAAAGNNGSGVTGVNWQAKVMALKFLGPDGGYTSDAVEAINYAVANGAKISNNSWGGGGYSQALRDAIASADANGHLFVAAAGNGGADGVGDNNDAVPHYPSSYDVPNVISVAATDDDDRLGSFSNFGTTSVDLGAPGVGILSTLPNNSYGTYSGTSMATPHVSGVAALMLGLNPGLDDAGLKDRILASVDPAASLAGKTLTGGRLNAERALVASEGRSPAAQASTLTLNTSPARLVFPNKTALSGTLTTTGDAPAAGQTVALERRAVGTGDFVRFATATTGADGRFGVSGIGPDRNTDYRAVFAGSSAYSPAQSETSRVDVAVTVSLSTAGTNLKLGRARSVSGAVSPNQAGSPASVEIRRNGALIQRKAVRLDANSRFAFSYKPGRVGTYSFTAVYPGDPDNLGNRSAARQFKVVR